MSNHKSKIKNQKGGCVKQRKTHPVILSAHRHNPSRNGWKNRLTSRLLSLVTNKSRAKSVGTWDSGGRIQFAQVPSTPLSARCPKVKLSVVSLQSASRIGSSDSFWLNNTFVVTLLLSFRYRLNRRICRDSQIP